MRKCCSSAWSDARIQTIEDTTPEGVTISYYQFNASIYPPAAETSPMIPCTQCGVPNPQNVIAYVDRDDFGDVYMGEDGKPQPQPVCLDCRCSNNPRANDSFGPSPFALAMSVIRYANLRLKEPGFYS